MLSAYRHDMHIHVAFRDVSKWLSNKRVLARVKGSHRDRVSHYFNRSGSKQHNRATCEKANVIWKGNPLETQRTYKIGSSGLGLTESVHERYWKMQHAHAHSHQL